MLGGLIELMIGKWSTETIESSRLKHVQCERCGTDFVYTLTRTYRGVARDSLYRSAEERAGEAAYYGIKSVLHYDMDLAPCPQCRHFQRTMVSQKRSVCRTYMSLAGILAGAGVFLAVGLTLRELTSVVVIGVSSMVIFGALGAISVALTFEPNEDRFFPYRKAWVVPAVTLEDHLERERARQQAVFAELQELGEQQSIAREAAAVLQAAAQHTREQERREMAQKAIASILGKRN